MCSYFFPADQRTHLNSIYSRLTDETAQFWSADYFPLPRYVDKPLYVLTSSYTFSGAEEFAYNMQSQQRGTLIGETTGGGAHPTRRHRLHAHFMIGVPFARSINPITGTNWEGTGITPDVAVLAEQAQLVAQQMALQTLIDRCDDDAWQADLEKELLTVTAALEAEQDA
jgi:C-terminal processing protease CtpA/Prc